MMPGKQKRILLLYEQYRFRSKKQAWSGTVYFIEKALKAHFDVRSVSCRSIELPFDAIRLVDKFLLNLWRKKPRKVLFPAYWAIQPLYWLYFRMVQGWLRPDAVFMIGFVPSLKYQRAYRKDIPLIFCNDAIFPVMEGYYDLFTGIYAPHRERLLYAERRMFERTQLAALSSQWALDAARKAYPQESGKMHRVHFGANLEMPPEAKAVLTPRQTKTCRLLFIGKEWERKGGAIAFETLEALLALGVDASLTVVGSTPPGEFRHEKMRVIPYLDKEKGADQQAMTRLFLEASFLILPSRAECFGIVVAEAAAFALPALVSMTGGLQDIVEDDVSGLVLPYEADGKAYAKRICTVFSNGAAYHAMCEATRKRYETDLNWERWGTEVARLIETKVFA
jgi:glycosyltransferase involved in cell wall biosynthesis